MAQAKTARVLDADRLSLEKERAALVAQMKASEAAERAASQQRLDALKKRRIETANSIAALEACTIQIFWCTAWICCIIFAPSCHCRKVLRKRSHLLMLK